MSEPHSIEVGIYTAIIDVQDLTLVSQINWHPIFSRACTDRKWVYAQGWDGNSRQNVLMHRLVTGAMKGQQVDHIDGNTLNNTRANLRICSATENRGNRRSVRSGTKFKGVQYEAWRRSPYRAIVYHQHKRYRLGCFGTAEEAARAYDAKALELFGEFAMTNEMLGLFTKNPSCGGAS